MPAKRLLPDRPHADRTPPEDRRNPVFDPHAPWPHNGLPHPAYGPPEDLPRDEQGRIPAAYYCTPAELAAIQANTAQAERRDGFTPVRQSDFLDALAAGASVVEAAYAAGVSRKTVYALRNAPHAHAFRAAWDDAQRCAVRVLADTAFDRAINGVEEPVFHQGTVVGMRRRYFERLMIHLLAVRDPLTYAPLRDLPAWNGLRGTEPPPAIDTTPERLDPRLWGAATERARDAAPPSTLSPLLPSCQNGTVTEPAADGTTAPMKATLYHNPRCSKSRAALALLKAKGLDVTVIRYLEEPPTAETLARLYAAAGMTPAQGLRTAEPGAAALKGAPDADILAAMAANPILIERPLVETSKGVRLGRPTEAIEAIL